LFEGFRRERNVNTQRSNLYANFDKFLEFFTAAIVTIVVLTVPFVMAVSCRNLNVRLDRVFFFTLGHHDHRRCNSSIGSVIFLTARTSTMKMEASCSSEIEETGGRREEKGGEIRLVERSM
jgi:hypothetical protein